MKTSVRLNEIYAGKRLYALMSDFQLKRLTSACCVFRPSTMLVFILWLASPPLGSPRNVLRYVSNSCSYVFETVTDFSYVQIGFEWPYTRKLEYGQSMLCCSSITACNSFSTRRLVFMDVVTSISDPITRM